MLDLIKDILTDKNFIGAIISSLGFILIGFLLTAYLSPIIHNIPESWGIFLIPCRIQ